VPPEPAEPEPRTNSQIEGNARWMAISLGLSGYFVPARFTVTDGGSLDLGVVARLSMSPKNRFEVGVELRGIRTADVEQYAVGVPLRFLFGAGRNLELELGVTPGYYRIVFDSPYFESVGAFGGRASLGMQIPIGSHFFFGLSPATFLVLMSGNVAPLFAYEPRFWLGAGFL
jgi:hypothetical protein